MAPAEPSPRFLAPILVATDFAATVRFYADVLGARVSGDRPYAEIRSPTALLTIFDAAFLRRSHEIDVPLAAPGIVPASTLLSFEVDDLEQVFQRLAAAGVAWLSPPSDQLPIGRRYATLRDPDGRTVVVMGPRRPGS